MIHFDNHQSEVLASVTGGVIMGVVKAMYEYGFHIAEVAIYGTIGGFCGMLGKWVWTKHFAPKAEGNDKG